MSWCAESARCPASPHPVHHLVLKEGTCCLQDSSLALFMQESLAHMELQSQGEAEHSLLLLHPSHNQEPSATSPHTPWTWWHGPGLCPGLHPSP